MAEFEEQTPQENNTDNLDFFLRDQLGNIRKWTRFLAILGFISTGLIALVGIFFIIGINILGFMNQVPSNEGIPNFMMSFMGIIYLGLGALYFYPANKLYQYSQSLNTALQTNTQNMLNNSFQHLKSFFRFWGILGLIAVILYGLAFLIGIFGALAGSFMAF